MQANRRFYVLISTAAVSLAVIVLLLLPGARGPASAETASSSPAMYTVGEWDGRLAVFSGGGREPDEVFDVFISTLPEEEQDRLRAGIPVEDEARLNRLLEDYTS